MLIENWIKGKVGFNITDLNISAILDDRGVVPETDTADMELRTKELCWADALMMYVTSANKGAYQVTDGGSTETEGSEYFVDRDDIQAFAESLYAKWDESPVVERPITVKNISYKW